MGYTQLFLKQLRRHGQWVRRTVCRTVIRSPRPLPDSHLHHPLHNLPRKSAPNRPTSPRPADFPEHQVVTRLAVDFGHAYG